MSGTRARLWNAERQQSYLRERDSALARRIDEREGTSVALRLDLVWAELDPEERTALAYLVASGTRSCIGRCNDPLLARLVEKGLLIWPPGVRPVLTDDLETAFMVPPAVWATLDRVADPAGRGDEVRRSGEEMFRGRITPIAASADSDPIVLAAEEQRRRL